MSDNNFDNWVNTFIATLYPDNADIAPLYHQRIFLIEGKPGFVPLEEQYATQEQIKRMNDLFWAYCNAHPF